jgi:hypothetical protein
MDTAEALFRRLGYAKTAVADSRRRVKNEPRSTLFKTLASRRAPNFFWVPMRRI